MSKPSLIEHIFNEAAELDPAARSSYLSGACTDAAVRAEVEALLALHDRADDGLRLPGDRSPARRLGAYTVVGELGHGGMGEVLLARDDTLKRDIALKVLPMQVAGDRATLERFRREAQLLAAINHPNIATIHSLEESGGVHFLTMELVEGETLAELLRAGPLAPERAIEVGAQIAGALVAAHDKGVVHRDLKPLNIMATADGLVKVLDFGVAKSIAGPTGGRLFETDAAMIVGTPGYMSPEQLRGENVDDRADLWAFGCVLYECLCGHAAFEGATPAELIANTLNATPDWSRLPAATPDDVRNLLAACLTQTAAERPSARDVWEALDSDRTRRPRPRFRAHDNLPRSLDRFVGRDAERAHVAEELGAHPLVTLTGAGGCGKTRLAVEVARDLAAGVDGVCFVELAPLVDSELVAATVAAALGVDERPDHPIESDITEFCSDREILIVLDNAEHVLPACASLADRLLRECRGVQLLVTSREALRIGGESVVRVAPLAVPESDEAMAAAAVSDNDAVRLFVERARAARAGFELDDSNAALIAQICRRLDGIPLALELAAARVRAMSPRELARLLDDRFRLLTGGSRTALPHHRTLEALVDWSYELLSVPEQRVMRALSVFAGGWTLDAAEAMCAELDLGDADLFDLLALVVDKSLVEVEFEAPPLIPKTTYRMLETVRHYMAGHLADSGEEQSARRRHCAYYVALAEEAEPHLRGEDQTAWLHRLELEHDNLRVAFDTCASTGLADDGLRLAGALEMFWMVRAHRREGRRLATAMLALPGAETPNAARAWALASAGHLAWGQGDYDDGRPLFEESLTIFRELDDRKGIVHALTHLADCGLLKGDYRWTRSLYEEALDISRQLEHQPGIGAALSGMAHVAYRQGEYERAVELNEQSLAICEELGDRSGVARSLNALGIVAFYQGDYDRAGPYYERYLAIARELGDDYGLAVALNNVGLVCLEQDNAARARELCDEGLALFRDIGDKRGIASSLENLGDAALRLGEHTEARALYEQSLEIFSEQGDRLRIALMLESFASLAASENDPERATLLLGAAHALRERIEAPGCVPSREEWQRQTRAAREALGEARFEAIWQEGLAMTEDDAVRIALGQRQVSETS